MTITAGPPLRIGDELNASAAGLTACPMRRQGARLVPGLDQGISLKTVLKQIVTIATLSILLPLCAAAEAPTDEQQDIDYHGSDCIWIRSIRDYRPLDDQTLLIWAGSRKPYLVRLTRRSMDMRSAIGMSVVSRDERLCPYGGDELKFGTLDNFPTSVRAIDRITTEQAEQLLVRYGKKAGSEPPPPAPREVDGAEVEELD